MAVTLRIDPPLLPGARSEAERHYSRRWSAIEAALGGLSCRLWRDAGVAVQPPSPFGWVWLALGQLLGVIAGVCAWVLVPAAAALIGAAVMDRPDVAVALLVAVGMAATGSLLSVPGSVLADHGRARLLRRPLDLAPRRTSARSPAAGWLWRQFGVVLGAAAIAGALWAGWVLLQRGPATPVALPGLPPMPGLLLYAVVVLLAGTLLLTASVGLFRLGTAVLQPSAEELRAADRRRPMLLLRSFGDDSLEIAEIQAPLPPLPHAQIKLLSRLEETIADGLRPFGPLVAIGHPGELVPDLGASRTYVEEESWRASAADMMREALAIVLVAGETPGLRWEIDAIARQGYQSKLLVLFPEARRAERWAVVSRSLAGVRGFEGLPREVPDGLVAVHASREGGTLLVSSQGWRADYVAAINYGLYGLLLPQESR